MGRESSQIVSLETTQQDLARNSAYPEYNSVMGVCDEGDLRQIRLDLLRLKTIASEEQIIKIIGSIFDYPKNSLTEEERKNYNCSQGAWTGSLCLPFYASYYFRKNSQEISERERTHISIKLDPANYAFLFLDKSKILSGFSIFFDPGKPNEYLFCIVKNPHDKNKKNRKISLYTLKGSFAERYIGKISQLREVDKREIKKKINCDFVSEIFCEIFDENNCIKIKPVNNLLFLFSFGEKGNRLNRKKFNYLKLIKRKILNSEFLFNVIKGGKLEEFKNLIFQAGFFEVFCSKVLQSTESLDSVFNEIKKNIKHEKKQEESDSYEIPSKKLSIPELSREELDFLSSANVKGFKNGEFLSDHSLIKNERSVYMSLLFLIYQAIEVSIFRNRNNEEDLKDYRIFLFKTLSENKNDINKFREIAFADTRKGLIEKFSVFSLVIEIASRSIGGDFFYYFSSRIDLILGSEELEKIAKAHDDGFEFLPSNLNPIIFFIEDVIEKYSDFYALLRECSLPTDHEKIKAICVVRSKAKSLLPVFDKIWETGKYENFLPEADSPELKTENLESKKIFFLCILNKRMLEIELSEPPPDVEILAKIFQYRKNLFEKILSDFEFNSLKEEIESFDKELGDKIPAFSRIKLAASQLLCLFEGSEGPNKFFEKIISFGQDIFLLSGYGSKSMSLDFWMEKRSTFNWDQVKGEEEWLRLLFNLNSLIINKIKGDKDDTSKKKIILFRGKLFLAIANYKENGDLFSLLKEIAGLYRLREDLTGEILKLMTVDSLKNIHKMRHHGSNLFSEAAGNKNFLLNLSEGCSNEYELFEMYSARENYPGTFKLLYRFQDLSFLMKSKEDFINDIRKNGNRRRKFLLYSAHQFFLTMRKKVGHDSRVKIDEFRLAIFDFLVNQGVSGIEKFNREIDSCQDIDENLKKDIKTVFEFLHKNSENVLNSYSLKIVINLNRLHYFFNFLNRNCGIQMMRCLINKSPLNDLISNLGSGQDENLLCLTLQILELLEGLKIAQVNGKKIQSDDEKIKYIDSFEEIFFVALKNFTLGVEWRSPLISFFREHYSSDLISDNNLINFTLVQILFVLQFESERLKSQIFLCDYPPSKVMLEFMSNNRFDISGIDRGVVRNAVFAENDHEEPPVEVPPNSDEQSNVPAILPESIKETTPVLPSDEPNEEDGRRVTSPEKVNPSLKTNVPLPRVLNICLVVVGIKLAVSLICGTLYLFATHFLPPLVVSVLGFSSMGAAFGALAICLLVLSVMNYQDNKNTEGTIAYKLNSLFKKANKLPLIEQSLSVTFPQVDDKPPPSNSPTS